jgi:transposase InsO family protein
VSGSFAFSFWITSFVMRSTLTTGLNFRDHLWHEWLDQHIIENIEEAQDFATQWLWTYNNDRPNMGIGGITPAQKLKMAA